MKFFNLRFFFSCQYRITSSVSLQAAVQQRHSGLKSGSFKDRRLVPLKRRTLHCDGVISGFEEGTRQWKSPFARLPPK